MVQHPFRALCLQNVRAHADFCTKLVMQTTAVKVDGLRKELSSRDLHPRQLEGEFEPLLLDDDKEL